MAPSEAAILEQFLLAAAQLPIILSLDDFTAFFPKRLQQSPSYATAIRTLYRDLQRQRAAVVEDVAAAIDDEVARGRILRRHALRARLQAAAQEDTAADDELQIEGIVSHAGGLTDSHASHGGADSNVIVASMSLPAVVEELDAAVEDLETELERLRDEEAHLREHLKQTVGSLSDLRYGRLSNPQLRDEVLEGLQNVQDACEAVASTTTPNT